MEILQWVLDYGVKQTCVEALPLLLTSFGPLGKSLVLLYLLLHL